ncbi:hypothetical protein F4774DRAFT_384238 [Daldinia eschscholtzii]|nr:hypothetical protein F4774DRAFT_384238 [Daldinia eschscholtzii]
MGCHTLYILRSGLTLALALSNASAKRYWPDIIAAVSGSRSLSGLSSLFAPYDINPSNVAEVSHREEFFWINIFKADGFLEVRSSTGIRFRVIRYSITLCKPPRAAI